MINAKKLCDGFLTSVDTNSPADTDIIINISMITATSRNISGMMIFFIPEKPVVTDSTAVIIRACMTAYIACGTYFASRYTGIFKFPMHSRLYITLSLLMSEIELKSPMNIPETAINKYVNCNLSDGMKYAPPPKMAGNITINTIFHAFSLKSSSKFLFKYIPNCFLL